MNFSSQRLMSAVRMSVDCVGVNDIGGVQCSSDSACGRHFDAVVRYPVNLFRKHKRVDTESASKQLKEKNTFGKVNCVKAIFLDG